MTGPTTPLAAAGDFGTPADVALRLEGVATAHPALASLLGEAARMLRSIAGTMAKDPTNAERARAYRANRRARQRDASATLGVTMRDSSRDGGGVGGEVLGSESFGIESLETKQETKKEEPKLSLIQPPLRAEPSRDASRSDAHDADVLVANPIRGISAGFARFYNAYPTGSRIRSCAHHWKNCGLEAQTTRILAGLELWKACERWQTGHVLNMRSFLTECMWEQAPPAPKAKAQPAEAPEAIDTNQLLKDLEAEKARRKAAGIR